MHPGHPLKPLMRTRHSLLILLTMAIAADARSDAIENFYTPMVDTGELELELRLATADETPRETLAAIGLTYGITHSWRSEMEIKFAKLGGEKLDFQAFEWENTFLLTSPDTPGVKMGLVAELEFPRDRSAGTEIRLGPLFQLDLDRWQLNSNLLFEKTVDTANAGPLELGYQWQFLHRSSVDWQWGIRGLGEVGKWNHWDPGNQQAHRVGPLLVGTFPLDGDDGIRFSAAWLQGISDGAEDNRITLEMEWAL